MQYKYRVWNIVNIPNKPTYYYVSTPKEAALVLNALADYQLTLPEAVCSSNVFGIEEYSETPVNEPEDNNNHWSEWYPENGDENREFCDAIKAQTDEVRKIHG